MRYKPRYLKNKRIHRQLNEFSTDKGRIMLNGELLRGVRSYNIVWDTGRLAELTINMVGKME